MQPGLLIFIFGIFKPHAELLKRMHKIIIFCALELLCRRAICDIVTSYSEQNHDLRAAAPIKTFTNGNTQVLHMYDT